MNDDVLALLQTKLLNYQIPHTLQMIESMGENDAILDASDTGTGKTYCALALAVALKKKPFIICPKSVIPSWLSAAEHFETKIFGIANYELLKGCKYYTQDLEKVECPYMDRIIITHDEKGKKLKKSKNDFIFQLPHDIMVIFDEAHRCKNHKTVTSRLLLSIKNSGNKILLLSATVTDKVECFKPFGVVFNLYEDKNDYNMWMRKQKKAKKIHYEKVKQGLDDKEIALDIIHHTIFPNMGSRMKIKELGDLFPKNQIISQSYLCKDYDKVQELYDVINDALEDLKDKWRRAEALGKIIRARQKIEMFKVPIVLDLAEEALDNGYSVVIFVNYKETMYNLANHLNTDCLIHGEQNMDERQSCIDDFQNNRRNVIICIMQAGGVGISLHDIHGGHPRMSLINPTWSGQDVKQALGRIHRAKSQSPAIQKLIFCAKTWEDRIKQIVNDKITNIDAINDGDLMGPNFKEEYLQELEDLEKEEDKKSKNGKIKIKKTKKKFSSNSESEKDSDTYIKMKRTKKKFVKKKLSKDS